MSTSINTYIVYGFKVVRVKIPKTVSRYNELTGEPYEKNTTELKLRAEHGNVYFDTDILNDMYDDKDEHYSTTYGSSIIEVYDYLYVVGKILSNSKDLMSSNSPRPIMDIEPCDAASKTQIDALAEKWGTVARMMVVTAFS